MKKILSVIVTLVLIALIGGAAWFSYLQVEQVKQLVQAPQPSVADPQQFEARYQLAEQHIQQLTRQLAVVADRLNQQQQLTQTAALVVADPVSPTARVQPEINTAVISPAAVQFLIALSLDDLRLMDIERLPRSEARDVLLAFVAHNGLVTPLDIAQAAREITPERGENILTTHPIFQWLSNWVYVTSDRKNDTPEPDVMALVFAENWQALAEIPAVADKVRQYLRQQQLMRTLVQEVSR